MNDKQETLEEPPAEASPGEQPPSPPEPVPFWHRPNIERYVVPILLPVAVILGLVVFVLSLSRLFLSAHGHIPVIMATAILLLILLGATLLSKAAHRLRQSSIALVTIGFVFAIMFAGVVVLGHSEEKKEAAAPTLPSDLKTKQTLKIVAAPGGDLKFVPSNDKLKTGLATIEVEVAASGHTLALTDPETQFKTLNLDAQGAKVSGVAYFGKDGSYEFICTVDGHAAAGMKGTIAVTGPPMTLAEAEKAAGN
jgi:plastocyanin